MTHLVTFLLDETGSMQVRKAVTISGFNEWMQEMEKFPGEVLFNLIKFHSEKHEVLFKQAVLGPSQIRLSEDNYQPSALTPLLDAVGRAIRETDEQLEQLPDDTAVILVILTDGEENDSKEFSLETIKALVKEKEEAGWAITYLGASAEAWTGAASMGISLGATMKFSGDSQSTQQAFSSSAMALGNYMRGGASAGGVYVESGVVDEDGMLVLEEVDPNFTAIDPTVEGDEANDENNLSED